VYVKDFVLLKNEKNRSRNLFVIGDVSNGANNTWRDSDKQTRARRNSNIDSETGREQFQCARAEQQAKLFQLWSRDRNTAILEYFQMTVGERVDSCEDKPPCRLSYENSSTWARLEDQYIHQVTSAQQMANTLSSISRIKSQDLVDSVYAALVMSLIESDPIVFGATVTFEQLGGGSTVGPRSLSMIRNRTSGKAQVATPSLATDTKPPENILTFLQEHISACAEVCVCVFKFNF